MSDSGTPADPDSVDGFDQTNGLAGNLHGDSDESDRAHADDDALTDAGSIYTGNVSAGVGRNADDEDDAEGSDGEEPI